MPFWVRVPNGSVVVLAIARPVSNPPWFVTNGYNNTVLQSAIESTVWTEDVSANRGIVEQPEAAHQPLRRTRGRCRCIAHVDSSSSREGEFAAGLAVKVVHTPKLRDSNRTGWYP